MIRRFLIAMAAGLALVGLVGARPGQAQQPPAGDAPPPLGQDAPPPLGDDTPAPAPKPGPNDRPPAKPKPAAPALPKAPAEPANDDPFAPTSDKPDPAAPPGRSADPFDPPAADAPKVDDEVLPAQGPGPDGSPLGPAKENGTPAPAGPAGDPLILPADRLPLGPSTGALTVDVQAPANANVNRPAKFKIFVKNTGAASVMGVIVRDPLPDGLEFVKSEPACIRTDNVLTWHLDSLKAGEERALIVTAKPTKPGDFDHAPTVSLRMGSRSRTMVKHPKLKVEITHADSGPILKGRPVNFTVHVTNTGTGPASGVVLNASLTPGLTHEQGSPLKVDFREYRGNDALAAGESETLELTVDAAAAGEQECKVWAESPDVEEAPEARDSDKVTIVEPKLVMDLKGSKDRYTDSVAQYTLTVTNEGSAPAKNVVAAAFLPNLGGQLIRDFTPSDATYEPQKKRLWWSAGDLEPKEKKELKFNVQLGGPGVFKVEAAAQADRCPRADKVWTTQVIGMPDIKCEVVARTKLLDVGEDAIYEVRLSNSGTKEATGVLVTALLTENLEIQDTTGTEGNKSAESKTGTPNGGWHDAIFPELEIPPKGSHNLTIRVKAIKAGPAKCTVKVTYGDLSTENSTTTKVIEAK